MITSSEESQGQPDRLVLEGVPRIGYDIHTCPFPGSLYSVLQYLGEPRDYDYLMAVSGACFRRLFQRDDGGNVGFPGYFGMEPVRRASQALPYDLRVVDRLAKDAMAREVRASIARGRPVLAFGIIGPAECGIIAGYDGGGEVMVGYSYFQEDSQAGYYETADWYREGPQVEGGSCLLVLEDKPQGAAPTERQVLVSTLEWAIDLERTPRRPGYPDHASGLAACEAWAAALEVDADYPPSDPQVMDWRAMVHTDQCDMHWQRHSAAKYLRSMLEVAPEAAPDLEAAAVLFEETGNLCLKTWPWPAGEADREWATRGLADPLTRHAVAEAARLAAEREAQAVTHLEAALAVLKAASGTGA